MTQRTVLPTDVATLVYAAAVLAILGIAAIAGRDGLAGPILAHVGLAGFVVAIVAACGSRRDGVRGFVRHWYPLVAVPLAFRLNGTAVPLVNPHDLDDALLAWDRAIFGAHPAQYLGWLETPWMTEVLRWCWMSYFVMPFLIVVPLYARGAARRGDFAFAVFALVVGWLASYLAYFATPAIGPGYFTERVGAAPVAEAPASDAVLTALFELEGDVVRDVCPSGHLIIAALVVWLAFRFRLPLRWPLVPLAIGLVVGTVYLRFHYGVDLLFGAVIAAAVMWFAPRWAGPS